MATGFNQLRGIDEDFCQCPICLQQYKEPRLLPCLHRYCSDCLKQLIEENEEATVLSCSECRGQFPLPKEGVAGFKLDFYMKDVIEYIHLRKSFDDKHLRECCDCSKNVKVTAYCFKCSGYLCKKCYGSHVTKKSLNDHKQHTVSLEELKSKGMTLEIFADLKEAPKCQSHPEDFCLHCCGTCGNIPICLTCTYESHENHIINDVGVLAKEEKEKLTHKLSELDQHKDRMLKMSENLTRITEELTAGFNGKKENFHLRHEKEVEVIKAEIEKLENDNKIRLTVIENNLQKELIESRKQMDEEIEAIKKKYDNINEKIKIKNEEMLVTFQRKQERKIEKSRKKIIFLEREFQTFMKTFEERQNDRFVTLQDKLYFIEGTRKRYENLMATGHSVLETSNDWAVVQSIPDICKAIDPLREDMKSELPDLEGVSVVEISPDLTEDKKFPVIIEGIKSSEWRITGITGTSSDSAVITGCTPVGYQSHITVINMKGKVLHQQKIKGLMYWPSSFCAFLSEFTVVIVRESNEIGLFDFRDNSYAKKTITDVISSWPSGRSVLCVSTDPTNKLIFVGGDNSREVYVFDDQLDFLKTLTLPRVIQCPYDMAVSAGNLLVCDFTGKRAFVVSTDMTERGETEQILHEFTKSDLYGDNWQSLSVCSDRSGFIYILWKTGNYTREKRIVVQYSQDGRQLLRARQIDANDATCMTTVVTGFTEKLLVTTWNSGKLFIYNIK